jgi:hypothetical protein
MREFPVRHLTILHVRDIVIDVDLVIQDEAVIWASL